MPVRSCKPLPDPFIDTSRQLTPFIFFIFLFTFYNQNFANQPIFTQLGLLIACVLLLYGSYMLLYSLKYSERICIVLSQFRTENNNYLNSLNHNYNKLTYFAHKLFSIDIEIEWFDTDTKIQSQNNTIYNKGTGLQANLLSIQLESNPFISIHISTYHKILSKIVRLIPAKSYMLI